MTDIDHIISEEAFRSALAFSGDKMRFRRQLAVLSPEGLLDQSTETLKQYGISASRIAPRGLSLPPHAGMFVMRTELLWEMGGYREDIVPYPQRKEADLKRKWIRLARRKKLVDHVYRPMIYMFPNGQYCGGKDFNPFNLFHRLSRG